ncbi:endo-1,4-beta-xylanase [Alkalicaulis satelles]|uniref:Beta-xylanase n=1 Tax=Alkalicaulis satelles TaxID=2609175 RepID=A0A5M6ZRX4_9PROT|nr:endo-1,4-beta-xylanase [Alkalicaulis satelles]KAA5805041.1 endo-1,4-beta-xylanase [Alkalicaulis satelles]
MLTRRQTLALGAGGLAALGAPGFALGRDEDRGPSLHALAQAKGMRFGSAVGVSPPGTISGAFHDPQYRQLLIDECGVLVHENELKWYVARPDAETFDFERADMIMDFAEENGMEMRGHTLLWHHTDWFPDWINNHDFGSRPGTEAERMLTEHVRTMVERYKGRIYSWDVVNETIDEAGRFRQTPLSRHLGEEVIDLAFHIAREADPAAELLYNDYMNWEAGYERQQEGVLRLLERLKARGAPIDGLGVQGHIGSGNYDYSTGFDTAREDTWRQFLDDVVGLDLSLSVTEFDVHDKNLPADIEIRDRKVAELGRRYLDLMFSYPQTKDLLVWGMADQYSWYQEHWVREDGVAKRPTPYDENFQPKPLRQAIADALIAAEPRP